MVLDILTPHGFIHEPSPVWPLPPHEAGSHIFVSPPTRNSDAGASCASAAYSALSSASQQSKVQKPRSSEYTYVRMSQGALRDVGEDIDDEARFTDIRSQIQLYATMS